MRSARCKRAAGRRPRTLPSGARQAPANVLLDLAAALGMGVHHGAEVDFLQAEPGASVARPCRLVKVRGDREIRIGHRTGTRRVLVERPGRPDRGSAGA